MKALRLWMVVVHAFLWGCTPSDPPGERDREAFSGAQLSKTLSSIYCHRFAECKLDIKPVYVFFPDLCEQLMREQFRKVLEPLDQLVQSGTVTFRGDGLFQCVRAMSEGSCETFDVQDYEEACEDVFRGTLQIGDPCFRTEECRNGYCASSEQCPGICAQLSSEGETCAEGGERQCEAGLDCGPNDICFEKDGNIVRGLSGQLCRGSTCAHGLTCLATDPRRCATYESVFRLDEGSSCGTLNAGAVTPQCAPELICGFSAESAASGQGRCTSVPALGAPCRVATVAPRAWCQAGSYCAGIAPDDGLYEGICELLPSEGEPCGALPGMPPICGEGLVCIEALCKPALENMAKCSADENCVSGRCKGRKCVQACDNP